MSAWAVVNHLIVFAGVGTMGALICRLDLLRWPTHRAGVIVMHQSLFAACLWATADAATGQPTIGGAAAILGTLAWLRVSYSTWAGGQVPSWALKQQT